MILADFDPGTLTAFYIMLATTLLVVVWLIVAIVSLGGRGKKTAVRYVKVAGICLATGLCAAIAIVWLSQKGKEMKANPRSNETH